MRASLTGNDDTFVLAGRQIQAFGVEIAAADRGSFVPGLNYSIEPINTSDVYKWTVADGLTVQGPALN
ncbi:MAG: hypothetical protein ACLQVD_02015 [Capsulimonadaceae bacterium]